MLSNNNNNNQQTNSHNNKNNNNNILKEVQGSGKAAFPGEKMITDESPRMEEEELFINSCSIDFT